ncbi:lipoyl(octanoyl) transferase LipB [Candidatus Pandoraea novymonadis]|uniref:Octanoyltransferase n=1 Tax=Candidatus Pandoraea novymonadis TaxID=1808959 RepID=A0ABX5FD91_9BURK|nr:lipoyl(octanoyl) transferase LipB [Candidatus Pandoraea novymonadis]PSB91734.1 Octanoyltransferase [Candidatus Pandoraea novymonadis]
MNIPIEIYWRGIEDYTTTFKAMRIMTDMRSSNTSDQLWIVEHPPVYTLGLAGDSTHLLVNNSGIPLVKVDRGGQITYHGPGQVVIYCLLDLRRRKLGVREMITLIEQASIDTLAAYNLEVERRSGAPGIYVSQRAVSAASHAGAKIAALGLKIRGGCSYHGVSMNVAMDLRPFDWINPCGYSGLKTVDMATLGVFVLWDEVAERLSQQLRYHLEQQCVWKNDSPYLLTGKPS